MARKIEYRIRDWLPHIIIASIEYEELTTLSILYQVGGRPRHIPTPQIQFEEIKSVLDLLVKAEFLSEQQEDSGHFWGIDFVNLTYKINPSFEKFIHETQNNQTKVPNVQNEFVQYTINQKNYTFNITFAIEKLAELKVGLINI